MIALHRAAWDCHLDDINTSNISSVKELGVNEGNIYGSTAIDIAAFSSHLNVTKYPISQGAKVNIKGV